MRPVVATAALAMMVAWASPAAASGEDAATKKEAQGLFTQGVRLTESGDLNGALAAFRAAHEKLPNYRVLYNIGKLCARLQDHACAVKAFEQYLGEGGAEVPAKRRAEVENELATAKAASGTIAITVNAANAAVTVDDALVGRSPLAAPVPVNPGPHKVVVTFETKSFDRTVNVAAGEATAVDVQIPPDPPPEAAPPVAAEEPPKPPPKPKPRSAVPWVVTGSLAAATVVTGVLAAVSYGSYKDKQEQFPVTPEELASAQSTARSLFLVSGALGALTIISAGVAGYFSLQTSGAPSPPARASVALGPRGLFLEGILP